MLLNPPVPPKGVCPCPRGTLFARPVSAALVWGVPRGGFCRLPRGGFPAVPPPLTEPSGAMLPSAPPEERGVEGALKGPRAPLEPALPEPGVMAPSAAPFDPLCPVDAGDAAREEPGVLRADREAGGAFWA